MLGISLTWAIFPLLLVVLVFRMTRSVRFTSNALTLVVYALITLAIYYTGGASSIFLGFYFTLVTMAFQCTGHRHDAVFWAGMGLTTVAAFYVLELLGIAVPDIGRGNAGLLALLNTVRAFFLTLLSYFTLRGFQRR